jgi:hypothetical protein
VSGTRVPVIEADLSALEAFDPASLHMTVSGRGNVETDYDPSTGILRHALRQRLYPGLCTVQITFKHGRPAQRDYLRWSFLFDPRPEYLSDLRSLGLHPEESKDPAP